MKKHITFNVEIIKEEDGKGYYAIVPSLPGCLSQGRTIEVTKKNISEAISLHLKALRKSGQKIPCGETYQTFIEVAA